MPGWLACLGTGVSGLFAGSALYITAIEHPAALSAGKHVFWPYVKRALPNGVKVQGSLALLGGLTAVGFSLSSSCNASPFSKKLWATAGALMLANWPYSMLVIFPVNKKLLAAEEPSEEEKEELYRSWGRKHAVRTALGVTSFALMLFGLIHVKPRKAA